MSYENIIVVCDLRCLVISMWSKDVGVEKSMRLVDIMRSCKELNAKWITLILPSNCTIVLVNKIGTPPSL